jgi:hypothetical protein
MRSSALEPTIRLTTAKRLARRQSGAKGVSVKALRIGKTVVVAAAAAALVTGAALAGPSASTKIVPFTAKYAGTAVVKVTDDVADISTTGAGTGTLIGTSKIVGKGTGDASQQPCVPFTGTGTMSATNGTKLLFKVVPGSTGCGDESGNVFSITGRAAVLKGTGKLAKAKGSLKLTGLYDRGKGTFAVKFAGKLTL